MKQTRAFKILLICCLPILCGLIHVQNAQATQIQFPEGELATESVLPVFDDPQSVKNRRVVVDKKVEIGLMGGYSLVEPFFNPYSFGIEGGYNFTESQGFNLVLLSFQQGISSYSGQLNPIPNSPGPPQNFNAQYAPGPKYLALASWQYTGFYGKMSITRDTVMNLSLFGTLGAGVYGIGDALDPVIAFGIGQNFYFTSNFALRADLKLLVYQGPDITSRSLNSATSVQSASSFTQTILFGNLLTISAAYNFGG